MSISTVVAPNVYDIFIFEEKYAYLNVFYFLFKRLEHLYSNFFPLIASI